MSTGPTQFDRNEREVEFSRALAFSDGVFAKWVWAITGFSQEGVTRLLARGEDLPDDGL